MLFFVEGEKRENPKKNSRSKGENQQQTQPIYDTGSRICTQAILVGGERSHHCAMVKLWFINHGRNVRKRIHLFKQLKMKLISENKKSTDSSTQQKLIQLLLFCWMIV